MEITEVRVKLVEGKQDKLKAFCSITIEDEFVVRDLKIIEGAKGLFVAMPSRKLTARCPKCGGKNPIRSNFCNECGYTMPADRSRGRDGRQKMHADIAHPINSQCRESIQNRVLDSYQEELEASQLPGYQPTNLDDDLDDVFDEPTTFEDGPSLKPRRENRPRERRHEDRRAEDRRQEDRRPEEPSRQEAQGTERRSFGDERPRRESSSFGERGPRPRSDRGRDQGALRGDQEENRPRPKKSVEPDESPPDDNFGAGLF